MSGWLLLELAVNIFQGIAMIYYPFAYLGAKGEKNFIKCKGMWFGLALAALISAMNILSSIEIFHVFENYMVILYFAVILLFSLIKLNQSKLKKLFISASSILIVVMCSATFPNLAASLSGKTLTEILTENSVERLICMITVQLMIIFIMELSLYIFKKFEKGKSELTYLEWILIASVLSVSCLICCFINSAALDVKIPSVNRYLACSVLGIVLINVIVCYLVIGLERKNAVFKENEILKLEQIYIRQMSDNAKAEFENTRKLRHDFKDGYSIILTMLSDGKTSDAIDFIKQSLNNFTCSEVFINTNNEAVNAVINTKLSRAKSAGIDVICSSVSNLSGIDDMDLVRLLSNLIDNAIEGCLSVASALKQIRLSITADEYKYDICVKNTISGSVLKNNPHLRTTKKDSGNHGYGTVIIREIAEKHNGNCLYYEENGFFCCNIIMAIDSASLTGC